REAELAAAACGWSAASLEGRARRERRVTREEAEREHERRFLRMWQGRDGFPLAGRLPAADGAVVRAALERVAYRLEAGRGEAAPPEPRCCVVAESLVVLAPHRL